MPKKTKWCVGTNMPGYMPDSDPFEADDFVHAIDCLLEDLDRDLEDNEDFNESTALNNVMTSLQRWKRHIRQRKAKPAECCYIAANRAYWIHKV